MLHIARTIWEDPWIIEPGALAALRDKVWPQLANCGCDMPQPDVTLSNPEPYEVQPGVWVVPITGTLMQRPGNVERAFMGAFSMDDAMNDIGAISGNPELKRIILYIDSPGGTVTGTRELADTVARVSKDVEVIAFTDSIMASAAYWIGSQADRVVATAGARIGSIGVMLPYVDASAALDRMGIKVELFKAGQFKGAGTPGVPLSAEQRAQIQASVDEIHADFKAAVKSKRKQAQEPSMEGQVFSARQAASRGLITGIVDGIGMV